MVQCIWLKINVCDTVFQSQPLICMEAFQHCLLEGTIVKPYKSKKCLQFIPFCLVDLQLTYKIKFYFRKQILDLAMCLVIEHASDMIKDLVSVSTLPPRPIRRNNYVFVLFGDSFLCISLTGFVHTVWQRGCELMIIFPPSPECWDYRNAPPYLAVQSLSFVHTRPAFCQLSCTPAYPVQFLFLQFL